VTTDSALEAALKAYEASKANRDRMKGKTEEYAELSQWVEATAEQIATIEYNADAWALNLDGASVNYKNTQRLNEMRELREAALAQQQEPSP